MAGDVDPETSNPSQEASREESTPAVETDDRLNDESLRSFVDTFSTEDDDPDIKVHVIGEYTPEESEETDVADDTSPITEEGETKPDAKPDEEAKPPVKPTPDAIKPDDSYPDEDEVKSYPKGSQKRIRQLVAARKRTEEELAQARQDAAYKRDLDTFLNEIGTTRESWDNWTDLGALVQKNGAAAAPILRAMAENLAKATGTAPATSSAPASRPASAPSRGLDPDLQKFVDDLDMTEEAANAIQATRANYRAAPVAPAPRAPDGRAAPRMAEDVIAAGNAAVNLVNDEYAKRYPSEWEKMIPEIQKEMARYKGSPPTLWGQIARDAAEKVVARRKGKGSPQPDPVSRANSASKRGNGPDLTSREGFVDAMLSGKLFGG
jgi:soluble cytochrome b562